MDDGAKSEPVCHVYEVAIQRIKQTFIGIGTDPQIGLELPQIFWTPACPRRR